MFITNLNNSAFRRHQYPQLCLACSSSMPVIIEPGVTDKLSVTMK